MSLADEAVAPEVTGLAAADHVLGDPQASVTLLEYGDYECPACIRAAPLVAQLIESGGSQLRFVYRHFPLMELHPHAELAAEAAEAAAAQGQFWPMHQFLFVQTHRLTRAALADYATQIGLDMVRFRAEMADRIYTQRVQEHRRAGEHSRLRATPAFFLNGQIVDVSQGFEKLAQAVHAALERQEAGG